MSAHLFSPQKMERAKAELAQFERAEFPQHHRIKPELIPLHSALEILQKESVTMRVTIPEGYTSPRFQHMALIYAERINLRVRTRTLEGSLYLQKINMV